MTSITRHGLGILHRAGNFAGRELLDRLGQVNLSMDIDLKSSTDNASARDIFRYCHLYENGPDFPSDWQKRSDEDAVVFEKLLRTVRDRYLDSEIEKLLSVIRLLESGDVSKNLLEMDRFFDELTAEKKKYGKEQELETFRIIRDLQIRQGMVDASVEALREIVEVHRETMAESPFSKPSIYDHPRPEDDEDEGTYMEGDAD